MGRHSAAANLTCQPWKSSVQLITLRSVWCITQKMKIDKILISIREHVQKKSIIKSLWYLAGNKNQIRISLFWCKSFTWMVLSLHLVSVESWKKIILKAWEQLMQVCTSYWRPGQTVSAFSYKLELSVSQSCGEFSGRACAHHENCGWKERKDEVSCHLAMTSARASVTSSNSVCSPSNNPLHSSSWVDKGLTLEPISLEWEDYLEVEAKDVAAAQNCPNLTTWCALHTVCLMMIMKVFSNMKGKYWSYWCQEELHLWQFPNAVLIKLKKSKFFNIFLNIKNPPKTEKSKYVNILLKIYEIT